VLLSTVQKDAQSRVKHFVGDKQVRKRNIGVHLQHLSRWAAKDDSVSLWLLYR